MTLDEIQELAGHREVAPWIVKLVQDAVEAEKLRCAYIASEVYYDDVIADAILRRKYDF